MKKTLLLLLVGVAVGGTAFAGKNSGTSAYLSWASGNRTTTNTASGAANNLFVRLERSTAMDFKGAEIDLIWSPTRDAEWFGCFERLGSFFQTSSTCTTSGYLNRGSNVPVTTLDDPNHYHVAWASDLVSACTQGNACRIQFETDLCADYGLADNMGCFTLTSCLLLDSDSVIDNGIVAGPTATVDNGTSYCGGSPVEPTTWGTIKGLFKN
jgi:hypothetical protein